MRFTIWMVRLSGYVHLEPGLLFCKKWGVFRSHCVAKIFNYRAAGIYAFICMCACMGAQSDPNMKNDRTIIHFWMRNCVLHIACVLILINRRVKCAFAVHISRAMYFDSYEALLFSLIFVRLYYISRSIVRVMFINKHY